MKARFCGGRVLENPRLSLMVFIGEDPKEQPEKHRVINTQHNPSHIHNSPGKLVVGNHLYLRDEDLILQLKAKYLTKTKIFNGGNCCEVGGREERIFFVN